MGLILGLAVCATVALATVLSFIWSGKSFAAVQGAQVAANNNLNNAPNQPTNNDPPPAEPAGPVPEVTDADHILGNKNAKVTIVEYSDFECPFCSKHVPTIKKLLQTYPKDVRVVYRHFPLSSIHARADRAAEASECAAKLGGNDAFWKMHDKLFAQAASQAGLNDDGYPEMAKSIGLDPNKMKSCLDSGETKVIVQAQASGGNDAGVNGTPANFINGKLLSGAQPFAALDAAVKAAGATQ